MLASFGTKDATRRLERPATKAHPIPWSCGDHAPLAEWRRLPFLALALFRGTVKGRVVIVKLIYGPVPSLRPTRLKALALFSVALW